MGAVAILGVLFGSSAGSGAVTPSVIVLAAPFHMSRTLDNSIQVSGCGTARASRPAFSLGTGNGTMAASARVGRGCASGVAGNEGAGSVVAGVNFRLPKLSGPHTIYVNWSLRASGAENITLGRCTITGSSYNSGCSQSAVVDISGGASIYDLTTAGGVDPNSSWPGIVNETYRTLGTSYNYTSPGPINQSFSIATNATFVFQDDFEAGELYMLGTSLSASASALFSATNARLSGAGPATAEVSLAGPHDGFALVSITIL